jgi:hypothetical protein
MHIRGCYNVIEMREKLSSTFTAPLKRSLADNLGFLSRH